MAAVEDLSLLEEQILSQGLDFHRVLSGHLDGSHPVLPTLFDLDSDFETGGRGQDIRLTDFDAQVTHISVLPLDRAHVLDEQRLGIGTRPVEPGSQVRPELPGLGLEARPKLPVRKALVAPELDLPEPKFLVLGHPEIDGHRAFAEGLDLEIDLGQVEALSAVEGFDPSAILEQQRLVQGGPGRQGQDVGDFVGVNLLVARDDDLPNHRILFDLEDHDPPLRARLGEDTDVLEEAE